MYLQIRVEMETIMNIKRALRIILEGLTNPRKVLLLFFYKVASFIKDDQSFVKLKWRLTMPYPLHLDNPVTYNEKQQWLKLFDRKPIYTLLVDKYLVKEYVAKKIGEEYIIPTIGVWEKPEDIDFSQLPQQFVLKCNHNSGLGMYICKDKNSMDRESVIAELRKGLSQDYYMWNREWPYKNVPRKIIAEKFMEDKNSGELRDYKFFCFDGEVRCLFIATDRSKGDHFTKFDFFDENFEHLPFTNGHPNAEHLPEKPECFEEMKRVAAKLSKGIPSVRVDLYEIDGKVYFGELTLSHWGGFTPFNPNKWDYTFGAWITLPSVKTT